MKMKKFISSLTAAVMAATTVLTSALVTPAMSFMASAADEAAGHTAFLHIQSNSYNINNYKPGLGTDANIVEDGDYSVSATCGEWGCESYSFFDLCLEDPNIYGEDSLYNSIVINTVKIGDKVRIVPVHICPANNLYEKAYLIKGDEVVGEYPILCKGKLQ